MDGKAGWGSAGWVALVFVILGLHGVGERRRELLESIEDLKVENAALEAEVATVRRVEELLKAAFAAARQAPRQSDGLIHGAAPVYTPADVNPGQLIAGPTPIYIPGT